MGHLVEELAGLVVWLLANWAYMVSRRTGSGGLQRFAAFWIGLPGTLVTLFVVQEGSQPKLAPPPDDEDALLDDVRRSRSLPQQRSESADTPSRGEPEEGGT